MANRERERERESRVYPICYKDADSGGANGDPAYTLRTDHSGAVAIER